MTDWRLLHEYLDQGSQGAFARLIERHMKLVYWTCRREIADATLAEDATQAVFLLFAQKARALKPSVSISGWLFTTARFVARDVVKREAHRRRCEEEVARNMQERTDHDAEWNRIEPMINEGLSALPSSDREALLLRYFDGLSVREMAGELGTTEVAARQRVSRAIERLRRYLDNKGVALSALLLGALLDRHSARAAPAYLVDATLKAMQHTTATAPWAAAAHTPRMRALLAGANLVMQTTKQKFMVAGAAVLLLAALGVPVALHHSGGQGPAHAVFTDTTGNTPRLAGASLPFDPVEAHAEIDKCYESRIARVRRGEYIGFTEFCSPDFTIVGNSGWRSSQSLRDWVTDVKQSFEPVSARSVDTSVESFDIQGDTAVATVRFRIDAVVTQQGAPGMPAGSRVTSDRVHRDLWQKRGEQWMNVRTEVLSDVKTINGKQLPPVQSADINTRKG